MWLLIGMIVCTAASSMRESWTRRIEDTAVVEALHAFSDEISRFAGDVGACDAAELAAWVGMAHPPPMRASGSAAQAPSSTLGIGPLASPVRSSGLSMLLCSDSLPFVCADYDAELRQIRMALFRSHGGRKSENVWIEYIVLERLASGRCEAVTQEYVGV
jgi:hypothetical protein